MTYKNLYCIMGPSGVGKTTLADMLSKALNMQQVASYTTRKPRFKGEIGHIFVTDDEFNMLGKLCAYTERNGAKYGITEELLGKCQLYVIDPTGLEMLRANYTKRPIKVIGLTADNRELIKRMKRRGDSDESITERMKLDSEAISNELLLENCDILITAHTIEQTYEYAKAFILSNESSAAGTQKIFVKTRGGYITAEPTIDPDNPGIYLSYNADGASQTFEKTICLLENTSQDCLPREEDYDSFKPEDLRLLIWEDAAIESYTSKLVLHTRKLKEINASLKEY